MQKLAVLLLSLICLIGCNPTNITHNPPTPRQITLSEAYSAICDVSKLDEKGDPIASGSGIILSNGLILTAAHVVDSNNNEEIDEHEQFISFDLDESGVWMDAEVIAISQHITSSVDLAILRPEFPILMTSATLASGPVPLGGSTIFIGRRRSLNTSITYGVANPYMEDGETRMSSASSWFGASGGGVFNEKNELVGVIKGIGYANRQANVTFPIPTDKGMIFVRGNFNTQVPIPNMSFYTPFDKVKDFLIENKAWPTPIKPKPTEKWWFRPILYGNDALAVMLLGFLAYRARRRA